MKYYLLNFSIIILGCSQNIGSLFYMTRRKLTVTGEGWKIKEQYKDGSVGQDIIESNEKDEDDFILINGNRYEKEKANKSSKIKLDGLPSQDGKNVQN